MEREEREIQEQEERERERLERESTEGTVQTEKTEGRGEKRPLTDTDPECPQSRQKKGQINSIFLSYSDEEAIVKFKYKQRKEGLLETVSASRNLSVNTVEKWFETQSTRYGKLTQTKSGQAAAKKIK